MTRVWSLAQVVTLCHQGKTEIYRYITLPEGYSMVCRENDTHNEIILTYDHTVPKIVYIKIYEISIKMLSLSHKASNNNSTTV